MSSHHTQHSFLSKVSSGPEAKLLEEDVRVRIAALPPPPTKAELRTARDSALKLLHDLFHCRGVRHLDGDLADGRWRVYSEKHILEGELGALQDEHRAILEELVDRKVDRHPVDRLADVKALDRSHGLCNTINVTRLRTYPDAAAANATCQYAY